MNVQILEFACSAVFIVGCILFIILGLLPYDALYKDDQETKTEDRDP